jgi:DNA repair protein RadC
MEKIIHAKDVFEASKKIHTLKREYLLIFYLNSQGQIVTKKTIKETDGLLLFSTAQLLTTALLVKTKFMILCHNHPSGNLSPSTDDITTTKKVIDACKAVGITLVDHVIVTAKSYYSMKQNITTASLFDQ